VQALPCIARNYLIDTDIATVQGLQMFWTLFTQPRSRTLIMLIVIRQNTTGNVHVRYYRGTFVQSLLPCKSNKYYTFWVCGSRLGYPACNSYSPFVIRGLPGSTVFSTLSHKCKDFRKDVSNTKRVFRFSLRLLSESFPILNITETDVIKKITLFLVWSTHYSCQILIKPNIFSACFPTNS
jgi:hypothetical protein